MPADFWKCPRIVVQDNDFVTQCSLREAIGMVNAPFVREENDLVLIHLSSCRVGYPQSTILYAQFLINFC